MDSRDASATRDSFVLRDVDELLAAVVRGDKRAFQVLDERLRLPLGRLIGGIVRDPSQSEEVTQEVFLEVWMSAYRFDGDRGNALSWIRTMATRRAIDRVRASQSSRVRDHATSLRDSPIVSDDIHELVHLRWEAQRLHDWLNRLPSKQREIIELVHVQQWTYLEAASHLGVAVGTIKSRLHGAMAALRATAHTDLASRSQVTD